MEREIKYPRCGKKTRQNKHGKSKAGSQRCLRKHCNKTYVTTYLQILYDGLHTSLKNKSQIYTVEGVNSDLRYYIKVSCLGKTSCLHQGNSQLTMNQAMMEL